MPTTSEALPKSSGLASVTDAISAVFNSPHEVPLRLSLPKPVFETYVAAAGGRDPEDYISDHLKQTVGHDHSGGLYFTAEQIKSLCELTGRGPCTDPAKIIERLKSLSRVKIGHAIEVSLDADVLDRLSHNYKVRKGMLSVEDFIQKEAVNGIRTSVGLVPR
jgi:hypothetical protein